MSKVSYICGQRGLGRVAHEAGNQTRLTDALLSEEDELELLEWGRSGELAAAGVRRRRRCGHGGGGRGGEIGEGERCLRVEKSCSSSRQIGGNAATYVLAPALKGKPKMQIDD